MTERIGADSALAREALRAAQRLAAERAQPVRTAGPPPITPPPATAGARAPEAVEFEGELTSGLQALDRHARAAESMPTDLLGGKYDDFHEIAVQLKSAELSFRFAMEIRNKLVDAYREIMRMGI